jgi:hypothetical protein
MSFPLQHNLADDTTYSMMHVPPQPAARGAKQSPPSSPSPDLGPAAAAPPVPQQLPWGPPPPGWVPAAMRASFDPYLGAGHYYAAGLAAASGRDPCPCGARPLRGLGVPLGGPPFAPPQPPVPVPQDLAALSEQRLEEIVARVVAAMLARERSGLPEALRAEARMMARAGGVPALAPDTEQEVVVAAQGSAAAAVAAAGLASDTVAPSRGLATGVIIAIVFGAVVLIIFGVIVAILLLRLSDPAGLVREAAGEAVGRAQDRALSRGLNALDGPLRIRSRLARVERRLLPQPASTGPARWLREALTEVEA